MSDNKKLTNNVGAPVADNQKCHDCRKKGPHALTRLLVP